MSRPAALAVLLALAAGAPADLGPRLAIDEPVFDFGTVERGTRVDHTFGLVNRGDAELRIEHVKSSCGCTVAVLSERVVPPGGEARVAVGLDTSRLAGRTTKTITVYTNDPAAAVVGLSLAGQVTADLVVTPTPLYLGHIHRGEPVRREVLVTPGREGATFTVERVEPTHPAVRARVEPRPDSPGQRIVVELDRNVPLGRFNETLTLHTTSPREPSLRVPVLGSVEGDVVVLPPQVTFGVMHGAAGAERELWIRNRGAHPVAVTKVVVPEKYATYDLTPLHDGEEYRLVIHLRDGLAPGKIESAIELFTDHPTEDHLVIPLYAIIKSEPKASLAPKRIATANHR